jgi:hypothetical protein
MGRRRIVASKGSHAVLLNHELDFALYSFFRAVIGLSVDALQDRKSVV